MPQLPYPRLLNIAGAPLAPVSAVVRRALPPLLPIGGPRAAWQAVRCEEAL